jgi:ceramide glucosyltransferase
MSAPWFAIYALLAGLAIVQSFVVLLQTWEHRRFARSQFNHLGLDIVPGASPQPGRQEGDAEACVDAPLARNGRWVPGPAVRSYLPKRKAHGKVMVYAPCKGVDVELEETLARLLDQDYPDYEVTFIVDSASDPAYWPIRRTMRDHPRVMTHMVIAGLAEECGQKVHNLRVATAAIPADVRYLAFIDSDAKPRRQWLRALVANLHLPTVGAASGYRWFVPVEPTLASCLIYSINCNAATLMRSRGGNLIWGGSWAVRRETFEALQLREAWTGVLTEDLVVAEQIHRHQLRVRFEPACMVASALEGSGRGLFSFLRRQYLLGRYYAPRWWRLGCATTLLSNLALVSSLGLLAWGLVASPPAAWMASGVCAALYALHVARGFARQSLVQIYCPELAGKLRKPARFDVWAGPLVSAVSLAVLLSSAVGRTMTWRGITYGVLSNGRARILHRDQADPGKEPHGDGPVAEDIAVAPTDEPAGEHGFSIAACRRRTA